MLERAGYIPDTRSVETYPMLLVPRAVALKILEDDLTILTYLFDESLHGQPEAADDPQIETLYREAATILEQVEASRDDKIWQCEQDKWQRILAITKRVDDLEGSHYDGLKEIPELK